MDGGKKEETRWNQGGGGREKKVENRKVEIKAEEGADEGDVKQKQEKDGKRN